MIFTRRWAMRGMGMVLALAMGRAASAADAAFSLEGTWVMDSAYEIRADGTRVTNYGEHPAGLLMVDAAGRYTLQIFRRTRAQFAAGDKTRGTAEEYREAVLGSSTHFGRARIDAARGKLVFDVEWASFPNWEGKQQVRDYRYEGGVLTYQVPASASGNGTTAYSVWRRAPVSLPGAAQTGG